MNRRTPVQTALDRKADDDAAASYFHAIRMCRLKGLLTGEFWPHEEDTFDLVMAAVMAGIPQRPTTELCYELGGPGGACNTSPDPDQEPSRKDSQ